MDRMQATVPAKNGSLRVDPVDIPELEPNELLIRSVRSGICPTGIHAVRAGNRWGLDDPIGYPGHEVSGEVVDIGDNVTGFDRGDRVVSDLQLRCGECRYCQAGQDNLCEDISTTGYFSHAEYVKGIEQQTFPIPDGLSYDTAAFTEPFACVLHSVSKGNLADGETALVVGAGQMGLLHLQIAKELYDIRILVTDMLDERLDLAATLGADETIPADGDVRSRLREFDPNGVDAVFVTVGDPNAQSDAIDFVDKSGTVVLYAGIHGDEPPRLEIDPNRIHYDELSLTGSSMRTLDEFERAVDLLASGRFPVTDLITHHYPLEEINEAMETIENREGIKAMIEPHS